MQSLWNKISKNAPIRKYPFQFLFSSLLILLCIFEIPGAPLFGLFGVIWMMFLGFLITKDHLEQKKEKVINKKLTSLYISDCIFTFIYAIIFFCLLLLLPIFLGNLFPSENFNWEGLKILLTLSFSLVLAYWIQTKLYEKLFFKSKKYVFHHIFFYISFVFCFLISIIFWLALWKFLNHYLLPQPHPELFDWLALSLIVILTIALMSWINKKFKKKFGPEFPYSAQFLKNS